MLTMGKHHRGKSESQLDYSHNTWISLLGLLRPIEFFVTVDNFPIWRRHLAWAKATGSDLRTHIMQRFSSSMVFMSLLLGAELGVLFNSSEITSEMRKSLKNEDYWNAKFWIGVTIVLSVCVTITALVATFTAWGMISSVSDSNMRCVIRSSIGQYVTQLPTHLVVMALYLFMLWVVLFLVDMLSGVGRFIILLVVGALFSQVVIAYSAFGRLIVHTGAMGTKAVVSPELEQALLPSGLHASLLLRATARKKKRTSVVSQYRSENMPSSRSFRSVRGNSAPSLRSRKGRPFSRQSSQMSLNSTSSSKNRKQRRLEGQNSKDDCKGQDSFVIDFEEQLTRPTARAFSPSVVFTGNSDENNNDGNDSPSTSNSQQMDDLSHRYSTSDSSSSIELARTCSQKPPRPTTVGLTHKEAPDVDSNLFGVVSDDEYGSKQKSPWSIPQARRLSREAAARRESMCLMKSMSSFRVREEWKNENAAREIYDLPPPPDLPSESEEKCSDCDSDWAVMPRASILNRLTGWRSLRRLVSESPGTVEESLSPDDEVDVHIGGSSSETDRLLTRENSVYSHLSGR